MGKLQSQGQLVIQHCNPIVIHFFNPCTVDVVHYLRVFMPHLISYK